MNCAVIFFMYTQNEFWVYNKSCGKLQFVEQLRHERAYVTRAFQHARPDVINARNRM